jgi:hypothetical protein
MTAAEIKDIDMSFGCTGEEAMTIFKAKSWTTSKTQFGLVKIGVVKPNTLYLEGKSISGLNFDVNPLDASQPKAISCDLHAEAVTRDFALNALNYDPFNKVILDPTGYGVEDSLNGILRLPINDIKDKQAMTEWIQGNATKVCRYWKFKCKGGFNVVDSVTEQVLIAFAKDRTLVTPKDWQLQKKSLEKSGATAAFVTLFSTTATTDLGFDPFT